MRKLSTALRHQLSESATMKVCSLKGRGDCGGRITWEHTIIYQGKQLNEPWAIIPLCARHHGVGEWQDRSSINKALAQWVALNRATDVELEAISQAIDYKQLRNYLNSQYGDYTRTV